MISNLSVNSGLREQREAFLSRLGESIDPKRTRHPAGSYTAGDLLTKSSTVPKGHSHNSCPNPSKNRAQGKAKKSIKVSSDDKRFLIKKSTVETALIMQGRLLIERETTAYSYQAISLLHEALNKLVSAEHPPPCGTEMA